MRDLPGVDRILSHEAVSRLAGQYPHELLVGLIRAQLEAARAAVTAGAAAPSADEVAGSVVRTLDSLATPSLRRVINATGVILHTNLGRAPLSDEAKAAMQAAATGYSNLEFDLDTGARGSRMVHIEPLLCEVTGAEAGLVVNNNAAAVILGLAALARNREVIVSRGQAVEIGGSFRIPDVMRQSGARLVEVGTTNCTYVTDYEQAVGARTGALLRVHSSNFRVVGFTHETSVEELAALADRTGLPLLDDEGSGCLLDTEKYGLTAEPMVQKSIAAGVALVFFSGDKLVGGPQAGIVVGKKQYVDKLKKHPLARAVRIDKIRLAGLRATLVHYLKGEALQKVPAWRMIAAPLDDVERRARAWAAVCEGISKVVDGESLVGGGSLPGGTLPTRLVAIPPLGRGKRRFSARALAQRLLRRPVPVAGRVDQDTLLLDPRTVLPEEDPAVCEALAALAGLASGEVAAIA